MFLRLLCLSAAMALLAFASKSSALPTEIFIFAIAALGFNILYGMFGLLSFGHSVFFGGAAYVCAVVATKYQLSAPLVTLLGGLVGLAVATLFSLLSIRTKGIYFVMLTLTLGQVGYFLALALPQFTGGENGLSAVVRPDVTFFDWKMFDLQAPGAFLAYCAVALLVTFAFVERLSKSPLGSVLNAIRMNERRSEALGYSLGGYRLVAFALSGFITGIAGSLYASFLRFVPLNVVDIETAEKLVIMAIIGGLRTSMGPVIGAAVFLAIADVLAPIWPRWMMLMGLLLIVGVIGLRGRGIVDVVGDAFDRARKSRALPAVSAGAAK
ncbi:branched-chain amino acid ABC transporter permease [Variovorax sp. WDL1]|uniref:branched-chain amino acid ABC transporter permease n=2 Tax=Variovorax TaxID=34072 RepID=UPI00076BDF6E|nr:branched-chain amino acid ABC transporter permease [Variovorax sp. WDL1]KWT97952.1 Branched-chain amino acid transport system permease protein LivM [Variovorax sp. WDL1]